MRSIESWVHSGQLPSGPHRVTSTTFTVPSLLPRHSIVNGMVVPKEFLVLPLSMTVAAGAYQRGSPVPNAFQLIFPVADDALASSLHLTVTVVLSGNFLTGVAAT